MRGRGRKDERNKGRNKEGKEERKNEKILRVLRITERNKERERG